MLFAPSLKSLRRALVGLLCCTVVAPLGAQRSAEKTPSLQALREGFVNPPAEARLRCYWWWLNGNTDKTTITHDLTEMKAKGFGGALLVDANGSNQEGNRTVPAGPTFGSPAWVELMTHALREADRLGLEITLNITSGWNLGGPEVTPEMASKVLTFTRTQVAGGGAAGKVVLAAPEMRRGFYRQIAVLAYPLGHGAALAAQPSDGPAKPRREAGDAEARQNAATLRLRSAAAEAGFSMPDNSSMLNDGVHGAGAAFAADPGYADTALSGVRDVTDQVAADGTLRWAAPAGEWEILRVGYTASGAVVSTASGAWQGLAIDYLSRPAFMQYWDRTVEPLLAVAKPYKSLRYLATDSWELGGTNWTRDFREQFKQRRGYDPVPWLPVVAGRIVGDRSQSTRFLTDLRRTVADLVVSEHYDVFAEKAREHGMGIQAESGGPHGAPIDALETFRHAGVVQSEFWSQNAHRSTDLDRFFTKEASSASNIYGQRFVAQEGETSIGPQWSESLATDLKPSFDMGITEGMNRLVWHEFTSSPAATGLPGQEYFAGTHLNPKVTWWNAGGEFFRYLNRAQYVMQQGVAVDDVLYFYGDNVPNFVRLKADDPAKVMPGYDYDVTDEDALLRTIRVDGKELVGPGGVRWRLLAMPRTGRASVAVMELVERFVRGGGSVVGVAPVSVTGNVGTEVQARFDALAAKVWGGCVDGGLHPYGAGRVFCGGDGRAALVAMGVKADFTVASGAVGVKASSADGVDYVHRRVGSTEVYFVRNAAAREVDFSAAFRVTGKQAELWDGVTGAMRGVAPVSVADGQTILPLHLAAYGSAYVVFGDGRATPGPARVARTEPLRLRGDWSVSFEQGRGGPDRPVAMAELTSWTEASDPGVRFFSGTATYRATVMAPAVQHGESVVLRFNDVRSIARVRVDGRDAGTVWAMPYEIEMGTLLRPGENLIEVEVTNLWPNRIIGDLQPGVAHRVTTTNITAYKADSPLLPSGLIGPAMWVVEKK